MILLEFTPGLWCKTRRHLDMCSGWYCTTRGLAYGDITARRRVRVVAMPPSLCNAIPNQCHAHTFALSNPIWYVSISKRPILRSQRHIFASETNATPTKTKVPNYGPRFNTWRPRQNGRHFPDDIFKRIFLNENCCILMNTSLKCVPHGPINNIPSFVQIMGWRRSGDKPLPEPMMA